MYSDCSLFGMTFTRQLRGLTAHDGPAPAAWRYLPCNSYSNIFCWRLWSSGSGPRSECFDDIFVGILMDLGFYGKPQELYSNSTGHRGSGVNAASKSSRSDIPTSEGNLAPQTTTLSEQSYENAGPVLLDRPGPLQTIVTRDNATLATKTSFSSSKPTLTSTGVGSWSSTDDLDHLRDSSRGNSIASRSRPSSSSAHSDNLGAIRVSDARLVYALESRPNGSSASTWLPTTSIASLASPNSTIRTTASGSVFSSSPNASGSLRPMAAVSEFGEIRRLSKHLDSVENRTENQTRVSPWLGRRPPYYRPAGLRFPWIVWYTNPGSLDSKPTLVTATGSGGVSSTSFNIVPSGNGFSSAARYSLPPTSKNRTKGRTSEGVKPLSPFVGLSPVGLNAGQFNQTGHHLGVSSGDQYAANCSGLVTSTANVAYEVITSTLLVNETITLGQNATTPLPVLITPPPACQIITVPCEGQYCPSTSPRLPVHGPNPKEPMPKLTQSTSTSTLLVTKKSTAVVQQLSAVGNLFGPAQPNSGDQQTAGQHSGSSNPEMSTQSDDSSSSEPEADGQPPGNPTPPQPPTNGNSQSTPSNNQESDSQKPAAGLSGSQSTGIDDQTPSNAHGPDGSASNGAATTDHGDAISSGDAPGNGAMSSNDKTSNSGNANSGGGASSNDIFLNVGDASNDEGASSSGDPSTSEGSTSINGATNDGRDSSNREGSEPEGGSSADSPGTQYVSSMIMAGNLPVSIISNAVLVGSHTVKAGSPPTTVLAKGQTIVIEPSQIVAQGSKIPIRAAITPPPTTSTTIGKFPVVLQPQNVAIGSKTFEHGSSRTSVIYQGQTYSWDASHLVGAGTTVAFPSVDSSAPRVTAGGEVFSVFPSQLQAPGRNIPIPNIATASPFVYKGQTFSVNPSQIIASDTSITLPPARRITPFVYIDHTVSVDASQFMARSTIIPLIAGSGIVTYNGHILTIKPSKVIGPSTTIALTAQDDSAASPTAITTGGLTFSIGPSAAVVGSSTYSFIPGKDPATIETHGEVVLVGSNGVQFKNIHIPIPTMTPSYSAITQGDLTFSIAPSKVVVGGHTNIIHSDMTPITTIVDGHTVSIGLKGVGLAGTTIPLPAPKPSFSIATRGDITFSVAPSEVVVKDKTYSVASNKAPVTTAIDGQRLTIGPKGIHIEGTTVNLPAIKTLMRVTAAGVALLVGATDAVISGTTYAIGSGAPFQTVVLGSQTIGIGSAGIEFQSTTIAPEQTPVAVTAGGLTFSIESSKAVVNGTTYAIGSGAAARTIVKGSTTIRLGTDGVELPSTTIRPWSNATQTGPSSFLATSDAFSASPTIRGLTPIATGREGDAKHAAGSSMRGFHSRKLLGILLGTVLLGLVLI